MKSLRKSSNVHEFSESLANGKDHPILWLRDLWSQKNSKILQSPHERQWFSASSDVLGRRPDGHRFHASGRSQRPPDSSGLRLLSGQALRGTAAEQHFSLLPS